MERKLEQKEVHKIHQIKIQEHDRIRPFEKFCGTIVHRKLEMAEESNQFFTTVFTRDTTTSIPQLTEKFEQHQRTQ
jgi:hypothetical protein